MSLNNTSEILLQKLFDNYEVIRKENKWEHGIINQFISLLYTTHGKSFSIDCHKEFIKYINTNTKLFSSFRGLTQSMLASMLMTEYEDYKNVFLEIQILYDLMVLKGFKKSIYTPIAAYSLYKISKDNDNASDKIQKSLQIYDEMRRNHPFLTSSEDYTMAVLLSASENTPNHCVHLIEEIYTKLNENGFSKGNDLQMSSHILSFSNESTEEKVKRCVKIKELFKENGIRIYSNSYASISFLSLLDNDLETLVNNVITIYEILKSNKRFKWSYKEVLISMAIMIYSQSVLSEISHGDEILKSTLCISFENIIIAQNAAIIAASSAAAASAASSSST